MTIYKEYFTKHSDIIMEGNRKLDRNAPYDDIKREP